MNAVSSIAAKKVGLPEVEFWSASDDALFDQDMLLRQFSAELEPEFLRPNLEYGIPSKRCGLCRFYKKSDFINWFEKHRFDEMVANKQKETTE